MNENEKEFNDRLARLPEPQWVREMKEHYARTGTYRAEDLRRVLGDPTRSVTVPARTSLPNHFGDP
jgi:hypothetical protein